MALSMTGFGRGDYACESFAVRIELRAVNHRFLEFSLRLPRSVTQFEERLRREISGRISRGKIDVSLRLDILAAGPAQVRLDQGLASGYKQALEDLAGRFGLEKELRIEHFLHLPELFAVEHSELDEEQLWEGISAALGQALDALVEMRRAEGGKLAADLAGRVGTIEALVGTIEERAPQVPLIHRELLEKRLAEMLGQPGLDEVRIAQEVAVFADRCNITEELVRLRSHLGQLRGTLAMDGALGRKMDFILQEVNREINTIGAKASDLTIAQAVIEVKAELEKIREQVQNLE